MSTNTTESKLREEMTRFCPGCGSVGPVPDTYRDCCPDGMQARVIPLGLAEKCKATFRIAISDMADQQELEALRAQVLAPRGTDAQILKERELTASAIMGAIGFGYLGEDAPPDDAAWLRPFYDFGKADAAKDAALALPSDPVAPIAPVAGEGGYPDLPRPAWKAITIRTTEDAYTADQMRAFADAHLAAHRASQVAAQPSNAEIDAIASDMPWLNEYDPEVDRRTFARAILARFAAPSPVAPVQAAQADVLGYWCRLLDEDGKLVKSEFVEAKYGPMKGDNGIEGWHWVCTPLAALSAPPIESKGVREGAQDRATDALGNVYRLTEEEWSGLDAAMKALEKIAERKNIETGILGETVRSQTIVDAARAAKHGLDRFKPAYTTLTTVDRVAPAAPITAVPAGEGQEPVGVAFLCHGKNSDKTQCNFQRADVPEGTELFARAPGAIKPPADAAVPEIKLEMVRKALRRTYQYGQVYWQQADSEYTSQHRKSDVTAAEFDALCSRTLAALGVDAAMPPSQPASDAGEQA